MLLQNHLPIFHWLMKRKKGGEKIQTGLRKQNPEMY
jgi:hypothetical protein